MTHSTDNGPLRFALVGAGGIGAAHARALAERPDLGEIVAICDPRPDGVTALLEHAPGAKGFGSLDELLDAVDVDAAIVGTPHHLHAGQTLTLVRHGVPSLVEKPVTCTTTELRELHEASQRGGVFVLPGQTRRFVREVRWARARLDADPQWLGELTSFALQSLQDVRAYTRGRDHWILDARLAGGGVAISLAVHQLDLIRFLGGQDYAQVSAFAQYDPPFVNGAESAMTASFRMTNGALGSMQASYAATRAPFLESLSLIGRHGSLAQHAESIGDYVGPLTTATSHGAAPADWADQVSGWAEIGPIPGLENLGSNAIGNEQEHFVQVVRGQAEPVITLADNFNTVACIEALMRSAREGVAVEVEPW
jgi:predicted dehydrogenase